MTKAKQVTQRHKLTREMLTSHIEALVSTTDTTKAALKAGVSYPTFLARFKRAGLKITEVKESVKKDKVAVESIVDQVFKKIEAKTKKAKRAKGKNVYDFKDLAALLRQVVHKIEHSQAA